MRCANYNNLKLTDYKTQHCKILLVQKQFKKKREEVKSKALPINYLKQEMKETLMISC